MTDDDLEIKISDVLLDTRLAIRRNPDGNIKMSADDLSVLVILIDRLNRELREKRSGVEKTEVQRLQQEVAYLRGCLTFIAQGGNTQPAELDYATFIEGYARGALAGEEAPSLAPDETDDNPGWTEEDFKRARPRPLSGKDAEAVAAEETSEPPLAERVTDGGQIVRSVDDILKSPERKAAAETLRKTLAQETAAHHTNCRSNYMDFQSGKPYPCNCSENGTGSRNA